MSNSNPKDMWNRDRLNQLIRDGIEENLSLEYKGADALGRSDGKKSEIVKDVSAFANSSGGTLVYGIAEFQQADKRHLPEKIDPVNRRDFSREWLEQIIQSIQPRINGIIIEPVSFNDTHACYVVTVPQSDTAHQARDHVYYRRHNFNVLPMEDYELRDVMNRRKLPKVRASIFAPRARGEGHILVRINNVGTVLAKDFMVDAQVPIDLGGQIAVEQPAFLDRNENGEYFYSFRLGPNATRLPLFPDSHVTLRRKFNTGVTVRGSDGSMLPSSDAVVVAVYVDDVLPIKAKIPASDVTRDWVEIGSSE